LKNKFSNHPHVYRNHQTLERCYQFNTQPITGRTAMGSCIRYLNARCVIFGRKRDKLNFTALITLNKSVNETQRLFYLKSSLADGGRRRIAAMEQ
jgi:hypothetical protein